MKPPQFMAHFSSSRQEGGRRGLALTLLGFNRWRKRKKEEEEEESGSMPQGALKHGQMRMRIADAVERS